MIGLLDIDSKIPNLALMKIASYHKSIGDKIEWYLPLWREQFKRVYASKVFKFSEDISEDFMIKGGSGFNLEGELPVEIEIHNPDYSIYNYPHNIGFAMRGCRFRCKFCIVPEKEGRPKSVSTIGDLWTQRTSNFLVLLDNDFFGNPDWLARIQEIKAFKLKICFSQGLNIRIITSQQAEALASVNFVNLSGKKKQVHFAWDKIRDESLIRKGVDIVTSAGIKPHQMAFFVLIGFDTTPEQNYHRVMELRSLGCDPFVMPYDRKDKYQKRFARWVNHKAIFKSVAWNLYK